MWLHGEGWLAAVGAALLVRQPGEKVHQADLIRPRSSESGGRVDLQGDRHWSGSDAGLPFLVSGAVSTVNLCGRLDLKDLISVRL
ncbi:hypothetical protein E2562_017705 [Oryza meyeriana var. granulata]|uniref:Uncharacterized protein n=1 Tax=Oryza meyeriana var. granulata TaxID=110450 RepID=A0A6G1BXY0_9ORYZ|nr:hypothetical protein E2562_017705 [Oryza meyeriana var. granulata]KAF0892741.1 hypothetical protein E2562_017705 [Oryza meyeriana var. granulata]KAF0892742.1 hypothetical protein E2562_017705 [Oryza meyeriana var. granulata]